MAILSRARLVVGVVCAAAAALTLLVYTPRTVRGFDATIQYYAYIHDPLTRLLTTGDMLDIPRALQVAALDDIPRRSTYAVFLPPTAAAASRLGMSSLTYDATPGFLTYLLLPSEPREPSQARYAICWDCDMRQLHDVAWLWRGPAGEGVGRLGA